MLLSVVLFFPVCAVRAIGESSPMEEFLKDDEFVQYIWDTYLPSSDLSKEEKSIVEQFRKSESFKPNPSKKDKGWFVRMRDRVPISVIFCSLALKSLFWSRRNWILGCCGHGF